LDYDLLGLFMGLTTPMDASASLHGALSSAKAWDVFVASMASLPTEDAIDLFSSMQAATAPAVIGGTYDGSMGLGGGGGGDGGGSPGRAGAGAARSKVTIVNASACCAHGKDMPPHMRLQGRPHAAAFTLSADRDGNTTLLVVDGAILSHVELAAAIREFMKDFHYQSSEDDTAAGASAREKWRSGMASAMSRLLTLFRVTDPFNHSPFLVTEADITALLAMMPATPGNVLAQACAGSSSADMATIATLLAKAPSEQLRSLELLFSMIPFVVHQAAFPHTFPVPPVDVAGMSTQDAETALAERGYREEARNTTPGPSHRFDALCGAAAAVLHLHNARLLQPVTAGFTGANPAAWIIATGINAAVDAASTAFYSASRGPSYLLTGQPACTRGCTDGDVPSPCREILHGAGQGWVNPLNLATASIIAAAPRAAISPAPLSAAGGGGGGVPTPVAGSPPPKGQGNDRDMQKERLRRARLFLQLYYDTTDFQDGTVPPGWLRFTDMWLKPLSKPHPCHRCLFGDWSIHPSTCNDKEHNHASFDSPGMKPANKLLSPSGIAHIHLALTRPKPSYWKADTAALATWLRAE
jgi:hypothetical protein